MARDRYFRFRLSSDESSRLAQLAMQSHRTQSDLVRCLIQTANTQMKTPSSALELAGTGAHDRADVHSPVTVGAVNGSLQQRD